jgi:crotonobetainyl-CoA:carnitine CoA-transferase CaiB-like acyl-CoA transferase
MPLTETELSEAGPGLLAGVRVLECALLEPDQLGMILAGLGAEVIKVEPPTGDYIRAEAWPFVEGVSLLHWHCNRGKHSVIVDLRTEAGVEVFLDLVRVSDAVIEAMRPGALARRGLGYERLAEVKPSIVHCGLSGWGATGPYRDLASHGIGFDAWAGVAPPVVDAEGFVAMPVHTSIGIRVGPVWGAMSVCAALLRARATGRGCSIDLAQSDAAAVTNWLRIEGHHAHERPQSEVSGNPTDGGERREPGIEGMRAAVRYQYYRSRDGHVLLMASERAFWESFCRGVGRPDLYEDRPGGAIGDHAVGDRKLQGELQAIFETRTTDEWVDFGLEHNCPICPVHDSRSIARDRQFAARLPWLPAGEFAADLLPLPVNVAGEAPPRSRRAPAPGADTDEVLAAALGYGTERISALREAGAVGGG